ncbi:D-glycero-beta-D-manno-heptose 1,7-bisphosphate 7-phosphatase [Thiopseudomonas acetoxidans]|uniref:D,D-heptose 1,7-bisphosphate phosphatase n=1 Tax=Thiopseudomonas acetoxidans TaxID=3041622 RepID=A0ABT7SN81_9GAMM|nr:D-glycero-beta-D-manno-heptose 1,7-bisphosphate 7-phosphatase [Thiopseudomonas sp. CY1220]MDM7857650.1 D-glycero-beta-D-manno-heptose 1,7-bisphosphate 7-phosphatase [Thiopseudomonas sp. CY1220]NLC09314.1 D-glycero-beta-D-manno-heptose 1,7-bisphosphate 7-phosphatase [Gammaproteobacteria bacterium]
MKLIILDRDGVINHDSDDYIKTPAEWIPIDGSIEAIARLYNSGWTVAVATNQSGLARGYYDSATLDAMHDKLRALLAEHHAKIGFIAYCPHGPEDDCQCRKPKAGLLEQISQHYQQPLTGAWFVGDSLRDLQAAMSVQAVPVLVKTGKGAQTAQQQLPEGTLVFQNLAEAVESLLKNTQ